MNNPLSYASLSVGGFRNEYGNGIGSHVSVERLSVALGGIRDYRVPSELVGVVRALGLDFYGVRDLGSERMVSFISELMGLCVGCSELRIENTRVLGQSDWGFISREIINRYGDEFKVIRLGVEGEADIEIVLDIKSELIVSKWRGGVMSLRGGLGRIQLIGDWYGRVWIDGCVGEIVDKGGEAVPFHHVYDYAKLPSLGEVFIS